MPKQVENASVKKHMTKIKSCTKKYRKAVRSYFKASANLNKYNGTDSKRRTALYKKSEKANEKADKIHDECKEIRSALDEHLRKNEVVKSENKEKIHKLLVKLNKDEMDWSSNTSSMKKHMYI